MAYITLDEKIEKLSDENPGCSISLPLEMLAAVAGSTSLAYFMDTHPYSAKDVLEVYSIEKATGFHMELSRNDDDSIKKVFYVTFKDISYKVFIRLDDTDFFNREKIEREWQTHMPFVQPSDLVICAHPVYLLEDVRELLEAGFEKTQWDNTLKEGTLLTVLSTAKVDNFWFTKVLYRNKPMWAFGAVFKVETFEGDRTNDNHYI